MRKQRKIMMVLKDSQIDDYIHLDMTEIDIYDTVQWENADVKTRQALENKLKFRNKLAQDVSTTKLDYMLRVIKNVHGKGLVIDPDAFKSKLRKMRRSEKGAVQRAKLQGIKTFRSLRSIRSRGG